MILIRQKLVLHIDCILSCILRKKRKISANKVFFIYSYCFYNNI